MILEAGLNILIRNEVLNELNTQASQFGTQARSGRYSNGIGLQLCRRWLQFRREWRVDWAVEGGIGRLSNRSPSW